MAMARRTLELRHATLGPDNPVTAYSSIRLGDALLQAGRVDEATAHIEAGVAVLQRTVAPDDQFMQEARVSLAESWVGTSRNGEAVALLQTAERELAARRGPALDRARVAFALARALQAAGGDPADVAELLRRIDDALRDMPPSDFAERVAAWATRRSEEAALR